MSLTDTRDRFKPIEKQLRDAGIQAQLYRRPPGSTRNFTIAVSEGGRKLFFWPGTDAQLDVRPDPKHRQAVLHVVEPERDLPATAYVWHDARCSMCTPTKPCTEALQRIRRDFRQSWNAPDSAAVTITATERLEDSGLHSRRWHARGTVRMRASEMSFLTGIDETAHFVAELPTRCLSVTDAHAKLRPDAAKREGTIRQGEWFFVPVTPKEQREIDNALIAGRDLQQHARLEHGTHEVGVALRLSEKRLFASLVVRDLRSGRHEPILLDGWFKVIRNREVTQSPAQGRMEAQRYRWD